jgi:hypothetical protein
MKFLKKSKICDQTPIDPHAVRTSINGIKKIVNKIKRRAYRSTNAKYVFPREAKIERLELIIVDLKRLL